MSISLKEIERIESLAENKRDAVKLANFYKSYAMELRDMHQAASAEKDKLMAELVEKAQAVIDRWDSQDWKDGTHTGDYIYALRDVVEKVKKLSEKVEPVAYEVYDCPFCKQKDYDAYGLQYHLQNYCEAYGNYNSHNILKE